MRMLLLVMLLLGSSAFAQTTPTVHGQFFAGSADSASDTDRAVIGLSQDVEGWKVTVAADVVAVKPLFLANIAGHLYFEGDLLTVGFQEDHYSAYANNKLGTRWVTTSFADALFTTRDMAVGYRGAAGAFGYSLQVNDEVKGDKLNAYSLLLNYAVVENVDLVVGGRYSPASKVWLYNAAVFAKVAELNLGAEAAQSVPKEDDTLAVQPLKTTTYALTATYPVYKSVGLYARFMTGDDNWKLVNADTSLTGLTLNVAKGVDTALLYSHVGKVGDEGKEDNQVVARLAASF